MAQASTDWQKSSYSGGGPDNSCIELRRVGDAVEIRESEDPGVVITISRDRLRGLALSVKTGMVTVIRKP
ncbi:DUF397 domain-containing protein [Streptomyces sp. NPDC002536]